MEKNVEREQLEQAIAVLEAQRATLGDAATDAALVGIRRRLQALDRSYPEPQRKQVTALFADICGFTVMSESLDAEAVHEIVNTLWDSMDHIIVEHGGIIDKHMGDGVMALWGTTATHEDDPEWAVRAALAMQAELESFGARLCELTEKLHLVPFPEPIRMREGLCTGPVLLGEVGATGEFSAIGDAVNTASRLQEAAPVGEILIAHSTYNQVRGIFEVQAQTPMHIKGKVEPVQAYLVQGAKPRAFRMRTRGVEGIETSMVGRDAELQLLQDAYYIATKQRATHVITVIGEAGVGKSRLLYEFENWLDLLPESIFYLKGRATPEMQATPYGILRDMFAYRFDIRESDSAAIVLEKLRAGMSSILTPDQADLVGQMVGFDLQNAGSAAVLNLLGSDSFRSLAQAYYVTYMRAVAQTSTVIFLEDIHWADERSLDLLEHIIAALPDAPLLIVSLTRPSLFESRPQWGADVAAPTETTAPHPTFRRLTLEPLSRKDSNMLVTQILRKLDVIPQSLCDLIIEGAEGNPYYMEELIKVLIDDGVIKRGEERWRAEEMRLKSLRVPPTLTGVLQARLDSLPSAEREVLQRASVMGRLFWDAAVADLLSEGSTVATPAQVDELLQALMRRELVFRRTHSAFQGTNEYIFKHAILRDVTYETVLLQRRRLYHTRMARWLEAHAGERLGEYLGLIAGHYELAGEVTQAADYLLRAGKAAQSISAYHDAINTFEHALSLLPEEETSRRGTLHAQLGYAYRQISDYPTATHHLKTGLSLARSNNDTSTEVAALNGLGWALMGQGKYEDARPYLNKALTLARTIHDWRGIALALHHLGDVAYRQGQSDEAARHAWECLALYRNLKDQQGIAGAFRILGFVSYMRGQYADAVRHHEESRRIYAEIGDRWGVATGYINLGETARRQGQFVEAARYYEQSLPFFKEIDNRFGTTIALLNLGHAYNGLDDLPTAWTHFRESLAQSYALGSLAIVLECLIGIAWVQAKRGQAVPAAELLGLVQNHPDYNAEIAQFIPAILELLHPALPKAELQAALTRGAMLDLDAILEGLNAKDALHYAPSSSALHPR
ncbi:MAG: ATP-binding protein [Anaerolineae bacterium]